MNSNVTWRRSSACNADACVEVRRMNNGLIVFRSAIAPDEDRVFAEPAEFAAFVAGCKAGDFDDLCAEVSR